MIGVYLALMLVVKISFYNLVFLSKLTRKRVILQIFKICIHYGI